MWVWGVIKGVKSQSLIVRGIHSCSALVVGLVMGGDSSKMRSREKSVSRSVPKGPSSNQTRRLDSSLLVASTMLELGIFLLSQRNWIMARVMRFRSVRVWWLWGSKVKGASSVCCVVFA